MLVAELRHKLSEVESDISRIERRLKPMQEELRRLQEYRQHVSGLLQLETGSSPDGEPRAPDFMRKPSGSPHWKRTADQNGYYVGGDSAHRVVRRANPQLHASIPHYCKYDSRQYS